jgi:multiple sugar transport system substrate-binding protein
MALRTAAASHRMALVASALASAAMALTGVGASAQDNVVTLGSNASDPVPREAMAALVAHCSEATGLEIRVNTVDHSTFQDTLSAYLQGAPDDIFTWFAGYRMRFFANQGLLTPIDDVWAEIGDNYSDAFKVASTGDDGQMYFIPIYNYPWVVNYRASVFEERGYEIPATWEELIALAEQMQADGLIPIAFGDFEGWPAQGTFDILNMRLNGYQFHIDLMAGNESWTDPRVKAVFEKWKELLPFYSDGGVGQTWLDAAAQLARGEAGMYFLGTFAAQAANDTPAEGDIAFFPFPTLGTEFDAESAIDAPIDGFLLSSTPANPEGAKEVLKCFASGAAQNVYLGVDPSNVAAANDFDTSVYTPVQNAMSEIIANSGAIAQFLDRDTIPAFAGPQGMQPQLQSFLNDPDQDLDAYLQGIQDLWDQIAAEQG